MSEAANPVRIEPDAIAAIETPRGPNAEEADLFRKVAALVNAEATDPYTAFNALYGAMVATAAGLARAHRHGLVKHTLTHFRGHVAAAAKERAD